MRDAYTDNNLIDYYTIMFNFVTYWLLDLHFSFFYDLTSNDLQLSWAPGLPPAKSGPDRSLRRTVANGRLIRTASRFPVLTRAGVMKYIRPPPIVAGGRNKVSGRRII